MLDLMSRLLGAPSERIWPGLSALPHADRFSLPPQPYNYLRKVRPAGRGPGLVGPPPGAPSALVLGRPPGALQQLLQAARSGGPQGAVP